METQLIINNACIHEFIIFLFFLKVCSQTKSTFGCYIVKTAMSVVANNAPYER